MGYGKSPPRRRIPTSIGIVEIKINDWRTSETYGAAAL